MKSIDRCVDTNQTTSDERQSQKIAATKIVFDVAIQTLFSVWNCGKRIFTQSYRMFNTICNGNRLIPTKIGYSVYKKTYKLLYV